MGGISIDVDSVASHLEGYGFDRPPDDGAAYLTGIPRALEIFADAGARCTFFLIGEEAARHPDVIREVVNRGHEVASHSMTHGLPFSDLDESRTRLEVHDSRELLESLAGEPVLGFRAPNWDVSPGLMDSLIDAGYRYDASAYPSILLPLLRRAIARRSAGGRAQTGSGLWTGVFGPTRIHELRSSRGSLGEVPVCTAPWTRLPYYHTLRFVLPGAAFGALGALTRTRRSPVTYQFHAVDFMGVDEDGLDTRIGRHPGMALPLSEKLDLAQLAVGELRAKREIVPLIELVERILGGARR